MSISGSIEARLVHYPILKLIILVHNILDLQERKGI